MRLKFWPRTDPWNPMMLMAMDRMSSAMKRLAQAKRLGANVNPEKPLMKECLRALRGGDYARAMGLADDVLRRYPVMPGPGDAR